MSENSMKLRPEARSFLPKSALPLKQIFVATGIKSAIH
jgi:hypothetical protein